MRAKPTATLVGYAAAALFTITTTVSADTVHVPGDYATIQGAISACSDGSEIVVHPGSYLEAVDLSGKAVFLHSLDGPAATVIDATGLNASVVTCSSGEGPDTVIEGFTITGGTGTMDEYGRARGGGMLISNSSPTVTNCTFQWNTVEGGTGFGGAMYIAGGSSRPSLSSCTFRNNSACYSGGGILNEGNPTLVNCAFIDNASGLDGGGMSNWHSSPLVTSCTFTGNTASGGGGGVANSGQSSPTLISCRFSGNSGNFGGGIYNGARSNSTMSSCLFSGNSAQYHGGGIVNDGRATLVNCTVAGNAANWRGGGIYGAWQSSSALINCIFWNNLPDEIHGDATVIYSDVRGGTLEPWFGEGCMDADPLFVDPNDGDCQLGADSPCINVGSNYAPYLPDEDIEGNPRIQNCRVDMGACESPHAPATFDDCNENGEDDHCDIYEGTSRDCNQNGVPDECDIADGTSADYDLNGVPDECEDCNRNGVPDACDLDCATGDCASHPLGCGGSEDYDGDGIPNECDCPGDLDFDGDIDLSDLAALVSHYGMTSGMEYEDGDIDFDGDVDLSDLAAILSAYRTGCE